MQQTNPAVFSCELCHKHFRDERALQQHLGSPGHKAKLSQSGYAMQIMTKKQAASSNETRLPQIGQSFGSALGSETFKSKYILQMTKGQQHQDVVRMVGQITTKLPSANFLSTYLLQDTEGFSNIRIYHDMQAQLGNLLPVGTLVGCVGSPEKQWDGVLVLKCKQIWKLNGQAVVLSEVQIPGNNNLQAGFSQGAAAISPQQTTPKFNYPNLQTQAKPVQSNMFKKTHILPDYRSTFTKLSAGEVHTAELVHISGTVIDIRSNRPDVVHYVLMEQESKVPVLVSQENLHGEYMKVRRTVVRGDIIGCKGNPSKTNGGMLTFIVRSVQKLYPDFSVMEGWEEEQQSNQSGDSGIGLMQFIVTLPIEEFNNNYKNLNMVLYNQKHSLAGVVVNKNNVGSYTIIDFMAPDGNMTKALFHEKEFEDKDMYVPVCQQLQKNQTIGVTGYPGGMLALGLPMQAVLVVTEIKRLTSNFMVQLEQFSPLVEETPVMQEEFTPTMTMENFYSTFNHLEGGSSDNTRVSIIGTVMTMRKTIKNYFLDISSRNGKKLQLMGKKNVFKGGNFEAAFEMMFDRKGCLLGVIGYPERTNQGCLSLVTEYLYALDNNMMIIRQNDQGGDAQDQMRYEAGMEQMQMLKKLEYHQDMKKKLHLNLEDVQRTMMGQQQALQLLLEEYRKFKVILPTERATWMNKVSTLVQQYEELHAEVNRLMQQIVKFEGDIENNPFNMMNQGLVQDQQQWHQQQQNQAELGARWQRLQGEKSQLLNEDVKHGPEEMDLDPEPPEFSHFERGTLEGGDDIPSLLDIRGNVDLSGMKDAMQKKKNERLRQTELRNYKGPFNLEMGKGMCLLCEQEIKSLNNWKIHSHGKDHLAKAALALQVLGMKKYVQMYGQHYILDDEDAPVDTGGSSMEESQAWDIKTGKGYCKLCKQPVNSRVNWNMHIVGKRHLGLTMKMLSGMGEERFTQIFGLHYTQPVDINSRIEDDKVTEMLQEYYSIVPEVSEDDISRPLQLRYRDFVLRSGVKMGLRCELCNKISSKIGHWVDHVTGSPHNKNVVGRFQDLGEEGYMILYGEIPSLSPAAFLSHGFPLPDGLKPGLQGFPPFSSFMSKFEPYPEPEALGIKVQEMYDPFRLMTKPSPERVPSAAVPTTSAASALPAPVTESPEITGLLEQVLQQLKEGQSNKNVSLLQGIKKMTEGILGSTSSTSKRRAPEDDEDDDYDLREMAAGIVKKSKPDVLETAPWRKSRERSSDRFSELQQLECEVKEEEARKREIEMMEREREEEQRREIEMIERQREEEQRRELELRSRELDRDIDIRQQEIERRQQELERQEKKLEREEKKRHNRTKKEDNNSSKDTECPFKPTINITEFKKKTSELSMKRGDVILKEMHRIKGVVKDKRITSQVVFVDIINVKKPIEGKLQIQIQQKYMDYAKVDILRKGLQIGQTIGVTGHPGLAGSSGPGTLSLVATDIYIFEDKNWGRERESREEEIRMRIRQEEIQREAEILKREAEMIRQRGDNREERGRRRHGDMLEEDEREIKEIQGRLEDRRKREEERWRQEEETIMEEEAKHDAELRRRQRIEKEEDRRREDIMHEGDEMRKKEVRRVEEMIAFRRRIHPDEMLRYKENLRLVEMRRDEMQQLKDELRRKEILWQEEWVRLEDMRRRDARARREEYERNREEALRQDEEEIRQFIKNREEKTRLEEEDLRRGIRRSMEQEEEEWRRREMEAAEEQRRRREMEAAEDHRRRAEVEERMMRLSSQERDMLGQVQSLTGISDTHMLLDALDLLRTYSKDSGIMNLLVSDKMQDILRSLQQLNTLLPNIDNPRILEEARHIGMTMQRSSIMNTPDLEPLLRLMGMESILSKLGLGGGQDGGQMSQGIRPLMDLGPGPSRRSDGPIPPWVSGQKRMSSPVDDNPRNRKLPPWVSNKRQ